MEHKTLCLADDSTVHKETAHRRWNVPVGDIMHDHHGGLQAHERGRQGVMALDQRGTSKEGKLSASISYIGRCHHSLLQT